MSSELMKADRFMVFTFSSTTQALRAEKCLKGKKADFLLIPTLREISSSCGLSLKLISDNANEYYNAIIESKINIDGIYEVSKIAGKVTVNKVEPILLAAAENSHERV